MIRSILLIVTILCTLPVHACRITKKINEKEKALADIVFEGQLKSYNYKPLDKVAIIKYNVTKTIRGDSKESWTIVFAQNINVRIPKNIKEFKTKYGSKSIVGIRIKSGVNPYQGALINAPQRYKDKPILIQSVCSEPYLEKI